MPSSRSEELREKGKKRRRAKGEESLLTSELREEGITDAETSRQDYNTQENGRQVSEEKKKKI